MNVIPNSKLCVTKIFLCFSGDYWKTDATNNLPWGKNLSAMPAFTIRELEMFFESSGKTDRIRKRAENIIFDKFLDNIYSCTENHFFISLHAICSAS